MYKTAKLLKDVVGIFVEESSGKRMDQDAHFPLMNDEEKEYHRWRAKVVLRYFSPYCYDSVGYRLEFSYIGNNQVNILKIDERYDNEKDEYFLEKAGEENISLDEFIVEHLFWMNLRYPKTSELIKMLEEDMKEEKI